LAQAKQFGATRDDLTLTAGPLVRPPSPHHVVAQLSVMWLTSWRRVPVPK
jgi:hypothetical protein